MVIPSGFVPWQRRQRLVPQRARNKSSLTKVTPRCDWQETFLCRDPNTLLQCPSRPHHRRVARNATWITHVLQIIEFFARGGSGGANVADVIDGLRFGGPITDEHRSRVVVDAFRKLDGRESGLIALEDLQRRYDFPPATASSPGCDRVQ